MDSEVDAATSVLAALANLRGIPDDGWVDGSVSERALTLDRLKQLLSLVQHAISEIELSLIDSMESDEVPVPGVGMLRRTKKQTSTWRDGDASRRMREDLASVVAEAIALDVGSGELDVSKRNIALATMRLAYAAIPAFSSLKQAGREQLGLHLDDYRSFSTYYSIQIEEAL